MAKIQYGVKPDIFKNALGSTLLGSTLLGPHALWGLCPKFKIEIGRSQNCPKFELAQLEKRAGRSCNWLKSIALTWEDASVESERSQRRVLVGSAW